MEALVIIFLVMIIMFLYNDSTRPATKKVIKKAKNKICSECEKLSKKK